METQDEQVKIQLSDALFGGFNVFLPNESIQRISRESIVEYIISQLLSILKNYHLEYLFEKAKQGKWHIHDELIKSDGIIYVCNNCFNN